MPIHKEVEGYHTGAGDYVAGRPGYPPEAVSWLRDDLGLTTGRKALEVGAGTGKFLPTLLQAGCEVTALEPIPAMRDQLVAAFPQVTALAGTAEAIPLPDAAMDAMICAQSFHWFATETAVAEMCRVLVPGGRLGLIWNVRDESEPWVAALSEITERYAGDAPRYRSGDWRCALATPALAFLGERQVVNHHVGPWEQVVLARTLSVSFIARLPADGRAEVEREVRALVARTPALNGDGPVAFPYRTSMYSYRKS